MKWQPFLHCEAEVWVLVKTHGLGTTSPSLILSRPACFTCGKQLQLYALNMCTRTYMKSESEDGCIVSPAESQIQE